MRSASTPARRPPPFALQARRDCAEQMPEPTVIPTVDVDELIAFSYELSELLKKQNDAQGLADVLEGANQLQSSAYDESSELQSRMQDYVNKINSCKQEIDQIKNMSDSEVAQRELEKELQKEKLLRDDLRKVSEDIDLLDKERASIEERKAIFNKAEKEKTMTQNLFSMYASVSTIVPDLNDAATVSGHIVNRDENRTEKFDFDTKTVSSFEVCNSIWKMIDS